MDIGRIIFGFIYGLFSVDKLVFLVLSFLCLVLAVSFLDAMEYAEMHNAIFIETSAKTAVNVAALFVEISKDRTEHFLYLSFVIIDERQQTSSAYFVL